MSNYVGGLRARLIRESIYQEVHTALAALGWFDANRRHSPVTFIDEEVPNREEVPFNTAALTDSSEEETEEEIGSNLSEHRWTYYVDFYGESDALSTHFIHDVRDILMGRFNSLNRTDPSIPVYDWTQATPSLLFRVGIENMVVDRAQNFPSPRLAHWYALRFEVVDHYADEVY